jgi:tetratricopeptide (TPR) repeat protein
MLHCFLEGKMPAKNRQHEINEDSEYQFEGVIKSLRWNAHPPKRDYGLDYWIEVFSQGDPTGDHFHIQLKGTDVLNSYLLKREKVYSYPVPIERLRTWSNNSLPVYFILWDINISKGYWVYIQGFIESRLKSDSNWLNSSNKDAEKQIHISPNNVIYIGHSQDFLTDLNRRFLEPRDGKQTLNLLESFRGVAWTETRTQLLQLNTLKDIITTQRSERMAALELMLKVQPDNDELWLEKAHLHYDQHQYEQALQANNRSRALNPASLQATVTRASILCEYADENNYQPRRFYLEAIELYEQCRDLIESATYHYNLGNCYSSLKEYLKAIEQYDLALTEQPLPNLAAQIWKNRGTCFYHRGDHVEEKRCYDQSLELDPTLWQAYFSWAVTLSHLERYQEVEDIILARTELFPDLVPIQSQAQFLLALAKWNGNTPFLWTHKLSLKLGFKGCWTEIAQTGMATGAIVKHHDILKDGGLSL